jgi:beta-glucosidase
MTEIAPQTAAGPAAAPTGTGLPDGFRFGVATAAYQIEGAVREDGRGESIWDRFAHTEGNVARFENGDVACDHYHRFEEDLDLMAGLRIESYRFSIAWPRILPGGSGAVNQAGVDFYRRLVDGLLERGIEPIATLYHWDLPQRLQDLGGWSARDTAQRFAEYAAVVGEHLGDVVDRWVTINEPWVSAFLGHAHGTKAPGIRDWPTALRASHHQLLGHGLAVPLLPGSVGPALNLSPIRGSDAEAVAHQDGYLNRWFLDPVLRGAYPEDMVALYEARYGAFDAVRDGDLEVISAPIDFLGVNYYNPMRVRDDAADVPLGVELLPGEGETTGMGWEVDPEGLREVLVRIRDEYRDLPIYITENGAAYPDRDLTEDPERTAYLEGHLGALRRAAAEGVDVQRYCVWSLLDNFEWEEGYDQRFGIIHVDFATQERTPKRSALWYRDEIASTRDGKG